MARASQRKTEIDHADDLELEESLGEAEDDATELDLGEEAKEGPQEEKEAAAEESGIGFERDKQKDGREKGKKRRALIAPSISVYLFPAVGAVVILSLGWSFAFIARRGLAPPPPGERKVAQASSVLRKRPAVPTSVRENLVVRQLTKEEARELERVQRQKKLSTWKKKGAAAPKAGRPVVPPRREAPKKAAVSRPATPSAPAAGPAGKAVASPAAGVRAKPLSSQAKPIARTGRPAPAASAAGGKGSSPPKGAPPTPQEAAAIRAAVKAAIQKAKAVAPVALEDPFFIPLAGGRKNSRQEFVFLSLALSVAVSNQAAAAEVRAKRTLIRQTVFDHFRGLSPKDLATFEGRERARRSLIAKISKSLVNGKVRNVFFDEFYTR